MAVTSHAWRTGRGKVGRCRIRLQSTCKRARAKGPEVEVGFCAALGDYTGMHSQGNGCKAGRYRDLAKKLRA